MARPTAKPRAPKHEITENKSHFEGKNIKRRDQWAHGVDLGRPFITLKANYAVIQITCAQ